MAVTENDPLARAAELARRDDSLPAGWESTRDAVLRKVRATVRPGRSVSVPLTDAEGSRTWVNERVVVGELRRAIDAIDGVSPDRIRLVLDDDVCSAVEVAVVARYGLEIQALGGLVADRCRAALAGLLVEGADAVDVRLTAVDVSLDDLDL